jgi:outer membrane protein assembly factor BamB
MSTPVLEGGVLYGLSHKQKGQLFALDAASGKTLWLSEGRVGDNAALVALGPALLALTTDAALIVARPDPKAYSVLRTYTVADTPTWAHPAPAPGGILVKDRESLALWKVE